MATTTSLARVTGPVAYRKHGRQHVFPLGPCLLERTDDHTPELIWGAQGQHCAPLSLEEMTRARSDEDLIVLD